jgi:hypothetical protein
MSEALLWLMDDQVSDEHHANMITKAALSDKMQQQTNCARLLRRDATDCDPVEFHRACCTFARQLSPAVLTALALGDVCQMPILCRISPNAKKAAPPVSKPQVYGPRRIRPVLQRLYLPNQTCWRLC